MDPRPDFKLSKEDIADIKVGRIMKDFIHSEGWKTFSEILKGKIAEDAAVIELPTADVMKGMGVSSIEGACIYQEAIKGALKRSRWLLQLPHTIIETADNLTRQSSETPDLED